MPVRFDEAQWARIYALSGQAKTAAQTNPEFEKSNEIVYVLALEGDSPDPNWKWWERWLDTIVQTMQPAPALTHIELIIPPTNDSDEVHFATYLGKSANWGSGFGDSLNFYLNPSGNGRSWRAIPVMAHGATSRLRKECAEHVGTPYGNARRLFNYPFSVPPLRSLAWALADEPRADAHCATLTARCLKRALPELYIPEASAWYGPSTLFLELARKARMVSYRERVNEMATVKSLPETEEASRVAETLLRGSDDNVRALSAAECQAGIDMLCSKSLNASVASDVTVERLAQKQLAVALLRSSLIARNHRVKAESAPAFVATEAVLAPDAGGSVEKGSDLFG